MKVNYDYDENAKTCICSACGYKHTEELGLHGRTIDGDDKFIEMEGFELHSTDDSGWYPTHHTHTIYACPKCGVLQVTT